jgi:Ca2+-binding EF-hand superfamily protein
MDASLSLLALLALAVPASQQASSPITVTGHAWAPFVSPMGEPFRAHSTSDDTLAAWFRQADRNHDGVLSADEMTADAERFFVTLDTNHDGQIDPDELDHYEWEIAPEIQVNSRTQRPPGQPSPAALPSGSSDTSLPGAALPDRDEAQSARENRGKRGQEDDTTLGLHGALQGGARYGLLNLPEPVAAADADFNRAVSLTEFRQAAIERFQLLDSAHQGRITLEQLELLRGQSQGMPSPRRRGERARDTRLGNPIPGRL